MDGFIRGLDLNEVLHKSFNLWNSPILIFDSLELGRHGSNALIRDLLFLFSCTNADF